MVVVIAWCGALAGVVRGGEGIALSLDGVHWTSGAGAYGEGWGDVGKGITVEAGGNVYIRFYSEAAAARLLSYAAHGTRWGSWSTTGPRLGPGVGDRADNPVILRISNVGTPRSIVTCLNQTGTWTALASPGVYDLALDGAAMWTLPPLVIAGPPESPKGWRAFVAWLRPDEPGQPAGTLSVADAGGTGVLLALALVALAVVWRVRRHRRRRAQRDAGRAAG